jgi:hypothetical protein
VAWHERHPRPTRREVFISALDKQQTRWSVEHLLQSRGLDLTRPYRKVEHTLDPTGDLYVQDLLPDEAP